jgi:excisionase family DNA binding protein
MNDTTWTIYREYFNRVEDPSVAASLTLADAIQSQMERADAIPTDHAVKSPADGPLTVPEVAKLLRVRQDKVLSWIHSGRLRGYNVAEKETGRPKYRVNPEDLQAFTQQRAITQPAPKGRPVGRHRIPQPKWQPK